MLLRPGTLAVAILLAPAAARADKAATRECIAAATEGQRLRDHGKLVDARARFLTCSADACPPDIRTDCASWLSRVDATTPRVVLGARDSRGNDLVDVRVTSGGAVIATSLLGRPQALDPGPYDLVFESDTAGKTTVSIVLRAGDATRTVVATFPAPRTSAKPVETRRDEPKRGSGRTILLGTLGGGAILAAGASIFFALHARGTYADLERSCAPSCTASDTRSVRTDVVLANVSGLAALVLGAAFAGVAIFGGEPDGVTTASRGGIAF